MISKLLGGSTVALAAACLALWGWGSGWKAKYYKALVPTPSTSTGSGARPDVVGTPDTNRLVEATRRAAGLSEALRRTADNLRTARLSAATDSARLRSAMEETALLIGGLADSADALKAALDSTKAELARRPPVQLQLADSSLGFVVVKLTYIARGDSGFWDWDYNVYEERIPAKPAKWPKAAFTGGGGSGDWSAGGVVHLRDGFYFGAEKKLGGKGGRAQIIKFL